MPDDKKPGGAEFKRRRNAAEIAQHLADLTRLGWHSTMVLTGDPDQTDLLEGMSGLADIARRLEPVSRTRIHRRRMPSPSST